MSLATILSLGISLHRSSNKDEKKEIKVQDGYEGNYVPMGYGLYREEDRCVYTRKKSSIR